MEAWRETTHNFTRGLTTRGLLMEGDAAPKERGDWGLALEAV